MNGQDEHDDQHPNQCTHCGQWFSDADFSSFHEECIDCVENKV